VDGNIALCREPLVDYRIHEDNQTNVLAKVKNKEDYYHYKIKAFRDRLDQLEEKNLRARVEKFSEIKLWAEARDSYFSGDFRSAATVWKYKKFDCKISIFELAMARMPKSTFAFALKKIKEGKI